MLYIEYMIRRIVNSIKVRISPVSKKRKFGVAPSVRSQAMKNSHAAEVAANEVVSRYGDALKSLSAK